MREITLRAWFRSKGL